MQLPFLLSVPDVQCPFIVFTLTQAPESPVPLQTYSTTFQSVTVPGTSGTAVLKKMFILIRPLCSLTSKGSFPSHPQGQLSAAAILLPCFCPFIHSFLCRQRPSRLHPSFQENISTRDILKRQMYKLPHFILCPSELSHRFFIIFILNT